MTTLSESSATRESIEARHRGQALVLMVLAIVALMGGAALVIDGGNAFAQQRATQNGADAAAEAGTVVIMQKIVGIAKTDSDVQAAIQTSTTDNSVTLVDAVYTDIHGVALAGNPAPGTNPMGDGSIPSTAYGIRAGTQRVVKTYLAAVVGLSTVVPTATATAITGPIKSCDLTSGCVLFPVTVSPNTSTCDGSNGLVMGTGQWPQDNTTVVILPLCSNGPGNVGWIDWSPTAGGMNDVINSVNTPDNPSFTLPWWGYVTQTGNSNASGLESAINAYSGQVVLLPLFNATCDSSPDITKVGNAFAPDYGCPAGHLGGNGSQQWYRFPYIGPFQLCGPGLCNNVTAPDGTVHTYDQGAYINGGNAVCGSGNGATGCLVGKFVSTYQGSGTVDQNYGGGPLTVGEVAVNLIR